MTTISTKLPDALISQAKAIAAQEKITLDELILRALVGQIESLECELRFNERKSRGTWKRAVEILEKAPDVEPIEEDRLN